MFDVVIIGAGPSGMMCAVTASKNNKNVLLIDRNEEIGKKMRLTGGTRCNITNLKDTNEFVKNLPTKNGRFLYSSLSNFNSYDIYNYFESLNVPLKVEKDDKVFPKSDKSLDFIQALKNELENNKVEIKLNTVVNDIEVRDNLKIITTNHGVIHSRNVVISTGGLSYPQTGSTGFGHEIAKKLGHTITEIYPTESPVISHDPIIQSKELQGLSFSDVRLSLFHNQQLIKEHRNDLIITHFGLSGPAALKLSQFIFHHLKDQKEAHVYLDVLPDTNKEELINDLKSKRKSSKNFKTLIKDLAPNRYIDYIFKKLNINETIKISDVSNQVIEDVVKNLKEFLIIVHEVKPVSAAFVTGGGVSLDEIHPKTMESKIIKGLYFIGEVLDLHGYTGGYNITIALSTGYTAGVNIE